eukprot:s3627_g7.t1
MLLHLRKGGIDLSDGLFNVGFGGHVGDAKPHDGILGEVEYDKDFPNSMFNAPASTLGILKEMMLGRREVLLPLIFTSGCSAWMPFTKFLLSLLTCSDRLVCSSAASLAATPKPTMPSTFSVPARIPPS